MKSSNAGPESHDGITDHSRDRAAALGKVTRRGDRLLFRYEPAWQDSPLLINPRKASLAMKIGSRYRLKEIVRRHWESCARELKLPAVELLDRMVDLAKALPDASGAARACLDAEGIHHPTVAVMEEALRVRAMDCLGILGA